MKPIIISFPTIFLMFVAVTANFERVEWVCDTKGAPVQANVEYYIVPYRRDSVVMPDEGWPEVCPLDVVAAPNFVGKGVPVKFNPISQIGGIPVSESVNIEFSQPFWPCNSSKAWKVDGLDATTQRYLVTTGGETGNPNDTRSWFKIEHFRENYKLTFCTKEGESGSIRDRCDDIGVYEDTEGYPALALSGRPLRVKFKKNNGIFNGSKKTAPVETM